MIPLFDWPTQRPKCFKKLCYKKSGTVSRYLEFGGTPTCSICTLVKIFNDYYYFKIVSMRSRAHNKDIASDKGHFEVFPKEKWRFFIMSCLPLVIFSLLWSWFTTLRHASPDKICTKDKNFQLYNYSPRFGTKSEIYYSPITIHCHYSSVTVHDTVHSEFLPI